MHFNKINVAKKIIRKVGRVLYRDHSEAIYNRFKTSKIVNFPKYMWFLMLFEIRIFHGKTDRFTTYYNLKYTTWLTTQNTLSVTFIRSQHSSQSIDYIGPMHLSFYLSFIILSFIIYGMVSQIVLGLLMILLYLK